MGSTGHDGVQIYRAGRYYSIADSLAAYFIRQGAAIPQPIIDGCTNPEWYNTFYEHSAYMQSVEQNIAAALVSEADVLEAL